MRRTRCFFVDFVFDTPLKKQRATARKVERWRTRNLQERRATTSPYHKEQYINAFLEAQSAAAVHRHAVAAKPAAQAAPTSSLTTSLTASHELTQLAQELRTRYGEEAVPAVETRLARTYERQRDLSFPDFQGHSKADGCAVAFGAWRSADGGNERLRQRIRAVDVARHCVIREARTPPELSPEVFQRTLPRQPPPSVQRLLNFAQSRSFRAASKPVRMDRLQVDVTAALRALRLHSREQQRSVAFFLVFSLSCCRDWRTASAFVLWLCTAWPTLAAGDREATGADAAASSSTVDESAAARCTADASLFAALLFDTVRWASPKNSSLLPTLDELEGFCRAFHSRDIDSEARTAIDAGDESQDSPGPLWAPVVAAPLLAVAGLRESLEAPRVTNASHRVQHLTDRYCIHRSVPTTYIHKKKKAQPLAYMPALAWGEYLRALHRCGASLLDIQAATDRITDADVTRNALQLLSNTHVWNAYLMCSPGSHAVEVYENNLKAYRVKDTPATVAAVMTALLNEKTAEATAKARALWRKLRIGHTGKKVIVGTCSTVVAHARLLAAENNVVAVRDLLMSYEDLYEIFGIPMDWHEKQRHELQMSETRAELTIRDGLRTLHSACAAFPLLIPPAVQMALTQAARSVTESAAGGASGFVEEDAKKAAGPLSAPSPAVKTPELTAEDLAAMM
ncbi:hypothetical protein NQL31_003884 [Lotmaria passim]